MNSHGVEYDGMPQAGLVKTMKGAGRGIPFEGGWNDLGDPNPPPFVQGPIAMRGRGKLGGLFKGIGRSIKRGVGAKIKRGVGSALKKKVGSALKKKVGSALKKKLGAKMKEKLSQVLKKKVVPAVKSQVRRVTGKVPSAQRLNAAVQRTVQRGPVARKIDTVARTTAQKAVNTAARNMPIKARRGQPSHNELVRRAERLIYSGANF